MQVGFVDVRMGLIIVSNISNLISGGSSLKNFHLFLNEQMNEGFSENMSWFLLFIERTIVAKYLNSRTCSSDLPLKCISNFSSAPKHIDFVLISFTLTLLLEQNLLGSSNCL